MSYEFCSKIFENRLRFDKVTESLKVGSFLRHSVVILTYLLNSQRKAAMSTRVFVLSVLLVVYGRRDLVSSRQNVSQLQN